MSQDTKTKENVKFGINATENNVNNTKKIEKQSTNKDKFGVTSSTEDSKVGSFLNKIFRIFKLQDSSFWIKKYIYSGIAYFCFYEIYYKGCTNPSNILLVLAILNLILYPVFAAVLEDIQTGRLSGSIKGLSSIGISSLLNLFTRFGEVGKANMSAVIYGIITFVIFAIKWSFSFILGIISFIYMTNIAKKMGY